MKDPIIYRVDRTEMHTWPNTPGGLRQQNAAFLARELLKKDQDATIIPRTQGDGEMRPEQRRILRDAWAYAERQECQKMFQDEANRMLRMIAWKIDRQFSFVDAMIQVAQTGSDHRTIGVGIMMDVPPPGIDLPPSPDMGNYVFTRFPRDPDWMGYDPVFKMLRGLAAIIMESQTEPGTPWVTLMVPPHRIINLNDLNHPFPTGETATLKELLQWHGASPVWYPRPPE